MLDNLHFRLADPHSFDYQIIATVSFQNLGCIECSSRDTAKIATRSHGADIDLRVGAQFLEPDPVTQECSAAKGAGRVYCQDTDPAPFLQQVQDQFLCQGTLSYSRRACNANCIRRFNITGMLFSELLMEQGNDLSAEIVILDKADKSGNCSLITVQGGIDQFQYLFLFHIMYPCKLAKNSITVSYESDVTVIFINFSLFVAAKVSLLSLSSVRLSRLGL